MQHLNAQQGLVNLFTSDSFRLLCFLERLQTQTVDGPRVRESQDEIAELFHVSKGKLNPLMQSLVASGCLAKYRARSGYVITQLGSQVIEHIGRLEELEQATSGHA
jgi:predicted transcriptional regulator